MYVPAHFSMSDDQVAQLLTRMGSGDLVTVTADGPCATYLPFFFVADAGDHGALLGHVARNNTQWQVLPGNKSLVIVHGVEHYVSPGALPAHEGRQIVPTWDYVTVHAHGELVAHDDPAWTLDVVQRLTMQHEGELERPWSLDSAPAEFVDRMLRAIVGVELRIERIEAKAKMAQNKSVADVEALIADRQAAGDTGSADFLTEVSLPAAKARAQLLRDVAQMHARRREGAAGEQNG